MGKIILILVIVAVGLLLGLFVYIKSKIFNKKKNINTLKKQNEKINSKIQDNLEFKKEVKKKDKLHKEKHDKHVSDSKEKLNDLGFKKKTKFRINSILKGFESKVISSNEASYLFPIKDDKKQIIYVTWGSFYDAKNDLKINLDHNSDVKVYDPAILVSKKGIEIDTSFLNSNYIYVLYYYCLNNGLYLLEYDEKYDGDYYRVSSTKNGSSKVYNKYYKFITDFTQLEKNKDYLEHEIIENKKPSVDNFLVLSTFTGSSSLEENLDSVIETKLLDRHLTPKGEEVYYEKTPEEEEKCTQDNSINELEYIQVNSILRGFEYNKISVNESANIYPKPNDYKQIVHISWGEFVEVNSNKNSLILNYNSKVESKDPAISIRETGIEVDTTKLINGYYYLLYYYIPTNALYLLEYDEKNDGILFNVSKDPNTQPKEYYNFYDFVTKYISVSEDESYLDDISEENKNKELDVNDYLILSCFTGTNMDTETELLNRHLSPHGNESVYSLNEKHAKLLYNGFATA